MSEYRVNLEVFAGPLDLLLYLVRKEEVDIYDIPIARVTRQYIEYIEMLQALDIDLAGDFLVMAATLMEIKSAMLLPRTEEGPQEEGSSGDPRAELVRQLLEYKRFKDAANLLGESAQTREQRYTRPASILDRLKPSQEPELDLDQVSIWTLLEAFDGIMKATGQAVSRYDHIKDDTPIDLYQIEVLHRLQSEGPMSMEKIFEGRKNRLVMIGLFLGMLELIRNHLIWAEQPEIGGSILVKPLTSEPAEEAVQKAIYADRSGEDEHEPQESLAAEYAAQDADEDDNTVPSELTGYADDDEIDDDPTLAELSQIKEVTIQTGQETAEQSVSGSDDDGNDKAAPDSPEPRAIRSPIPIRDIGPSEADAAATRKQPATDKNEI